MIDIIAEYANIRQRVTWLERVESTPEGLLNADGLLQSCRKIDRDLSLWIAEFEACNPGAMLPALASNADPASRLLFPLSYQFKTLKEAALYLKYWATYLLLNGSMWRIETFQKRMKSDMAVGKARTTVVTPPSTFTAFDFQKSIRYARNICQSLDYVLQHTRNSSGPAFLTFPMTVAYFNFRFNPQFKAEEQWCVMKMQEMRSSGYNIASEYRSNIRKGTISLREGGVVEDGNRSLEDRNTVRAVGN